MSKEYDIIKIVDNNGNIFNLENIKEIRNNEYNKIVFPDGFVIDLKNAKTYYTSNDNAEPSEALECLEHIKKDDFNMIITTYPPIPAYNGITKDDMFNKIKQALKRLESIDNANPSEALEGLERLEYYHIRSVNDLGCKEHRLKDISTIKQALLKAQEQEKFFDDKLVFKNGCIMSGFDYKGKQIVAMPLEEYDKFIKQK